MLWFWSKPSMFSNVLHSFSQQHQNKPSECTPFSSNFSHIFVLIKTKEFIGRFRLYKEEHDNNKIRFHDHVRCRVFAWGIKVREGGAGNPVYRLDFPVLYLPPFLHRVGKLCIFFIIILDDLSHPCFDHFRMSKCINKNNHLSTV